MQQLADLDTSFLVPCVHCDALFQEGERFCPSCGEDQLFATTASKATGLAGSAQAGAHPAAAQGVGWLRPRTADATDAGVDRMPPHDDARAPGRRLPAIALLGIVAVLVLVALAGLWGFDRYGGAQDRAGRQRAYDTTVAQLRTALGRDDLAGAERAFALLDATQIDTPAVQALKQDLDQRMREQAQRREQLSNAAQDASRSLGFGAVSAAAPASSPAIAVSPPASQPAAPRTDCSDALVALALCKPW